MEAVLRLVLTNAAGAALIAAVAFAASRWSRRPGLNHALWLLALLELVTPPLVPVPLLPAPSPAVKAAPVNGPERAAAPGGLPRPRPAAALDARSGAAVRVLAPPVALASGAAPTTPRPAPRGPAARRFVLRIAGGALVLGALLVLGLAAVRVARFRRLLKGARPAPAAVEAAVAGLAPRLGLRRAPRLLLVAARVPPMVWPHAAGPRVLLPEGLLPELTGPELHALLVHELAHVRRRDHWVRFVELGATALFWWYPVTWWARAGLRRAEERCCDEWVLRVLPQAAEAYAQGLLKSLSFVSSAPASVPAFASGASPLCELEARFKEILMSRPMPHLAPPLRVVLLGTALLGLCAFPMEARVDDEPRAATPEAAAIPGAAGPAPAEPAPSAPRPARAPAAAAAPRVPPAPDAPPVVAPAPAAQGARPIAAAPARAKEGARPSRTVEQARRALAEQRLALEHKQRRLRQEALELERRELELEAKAREAELRAEAEAFRAQGQAEGSRHLQREMELAGRRAELDRRRLALEAARLEAETRRAAEERQQAAKLAALDAHGAEERAAELRRGMEEEMAHNQERMEAEELALHEEMEALERDEQVRALTQATDEMADSLVARAVELEAAVRDHGRSPDLDRELKRLEAAVAALRRTPAPQPDPQPKAAPAPTPRPQR